MIVKTLKHMKHLTLLRHAKSSWKNTSLSDFNRPLNKRGKRDAPYIAEKLKQRNIGVEIIVSSSAIRTLETANIFSNVLGLENDIIKSDDLYAASGEVILKTINNLNEVYTNVLVVSHNPGITNIANQLSDFFIENIPTTGIIAFTYDGNWKDLKFKCCKFLFYDTPKMVF